MQWVQTKYLEGTYAKFIRFKCNLCGITQEIPFGSANSEGDHPIPNGWRFGLHEGSHFCPGCEKPKRAALPIV